MVQITRPKNLQGRFYQRQEDPSPQAIQLLTEEIRATWTARERHRRANLEMRMEIEPLPLQPRRKGFWGESV